MLRRFVVLVETLHGVVFGDVEHETQSVNNEIALVHAQPLRFGVHAVIYVGVDSPCCDEFARALVWSSHGIVLAVLGK